jgi:hypothetical protein
MMEREQASQQDHSRGDDKIHHKAVGDPEKRQSFLRISIPIASCSSVGCMCTARSIQGYHPAAVKKAIGFVERLMHSRPSSKAFCILAISLQMVWPEVRGGSI